MVVAATAVAAEEEVVIFSAEVVGGFHGGGYHGRGYGGREGSYEGHGSYGGMRRASPLGRFTRPSLQTKRFYVFRSRCTTPRSCAAARPRAI